MMRAMAALMLALSAFLVPTAAADAVDKDGARALVPPPAELLLVDPGLPQAETLLDDATGLVDDAGPVAVSVDLQVEARDAAAADPGEPAVSPASKHDGPLFGHEVADVAAPAAGSLLMALLMGALAMGSEGLRHALGRGLRATAALLAFLPLFSRIERGAVMDNPVRARVHDAVAQEPGLSLSEVCLRAGIAWGTAVHHLRRLEAHGILVSVRERGHRRFFVANTKAASQRTAMAAVMHPTAWRIAQFVAQRPGVDQSGICQALGLNNPAASKHLSAFEERGLILSHRSGRSRQYHATGGLHSALRLVEPGSTAGMAQAPPRAIGMVA